MARTARLLLLLGCLGAAARTARAQTPDPGRAPTPPAVADLGEPELLRFLPHPPALPASLLAPAPPPAPPPPPLDRPYFVADPMLDRPELAPPGWFADLDFGIAKGHVKNQLSNTVQNPVTGGTDLIGLPSAPLDWAVSPRVEAGYRLPSGFGAFALSYRFLATQGSEVVDSGAGPARLSSLLDIDVADLDYASEELSLWPCWDMRWRLGLRYAYVYFDSRADVPPDLAAVTGVERVRTTNSYVGIGPHSGVELSRRFGASGLAFVARGEFTLLVGRIRQQFIEETTAPGPDGRPLAGSTAASSSEGVPVLGLQAGFSWQPPRYPHARLYLGYQYEYWWEVGILNNIGTFGEVADQGFILRAEFNY
jgi:hypothetical protein